MILIRKAILILCGNNVRQRAIQKTVRTSLSTQPQVIKVSSGYRNDIESLVFTRPQAVFLSTN